MIDRILERELQRNYSLEGSPDRLTPKASPIRRRSPIRSPERGRRTLFSPSKLPQNRSHNCRILIMSYLVKYWCTYHKCNRKSGKFSDKHVDLLKNLHFLRWDFGKLFWCFFVNIYVFHKHVLSFSCIYQVYHLGNLE